MLKGEAADGRQRRESGRTGPHMRSRVRALFSSSPAWGVAGFLVGAVFWHLVGFWSFVSQVVYKKEDSLASLELAAKPSRTLDGGERARQSVTAPRCVDLRLDRANRKVDALECEGAGALIKAGPVASRGDLVLPSWVAVPAVAGWSTQVRNTEAGGAAAVD